MQRKHLHRLINALGYQLLIFKKEYFQNSQASKNTKTSKNTATLLIIKTTIEVNAISVRGRGHWFSGVS